MIPKGTPFLKHLPPKTLSALRQAINACSDAMGMAPDWVQRWIAFTLVAGALTKPRTGTAPQFELKGGAAIELRLRQRAEGHVPRASRDLDAAFRGTLDDTEEAVRLALSGAHQGFTYLVIPDGEVFRSMRRFDVAVSYRGRNFSRVRLEVSAYEGIDRGPENVAAPSLVRFGFEGPDTIPCMPMKKQVAQKIHAVTEIPAPGGSNDRFRDLVDLVMLRDVVPASVGLREACEETFALRRMHVWPPAVVLHRHWIEPLERVAREVALMRANADEIATDVSRYVEEIVRA